jgi:hypothetical protein
MCLSTEGTELNGETLEKLGVEVRKGARERVKLSSRLPSKGGSDGEGRAFVLHARGWTGLHRMDTAGKMQVGACGHLPFPMDCAETE